MNSTTVSTMVRSVLKVAGGYLVAKGIGDEGTMEIIIGGITALVGMVWGYLEAKKQAKTGDGESAKV